MAVAKADSLILVLSHPTNMEFIPRRSLGLLTFSPVSGTVSTNVFIPAALVVAILVILAGAYILFVYGNSSQSAYDITTAYNVLTYNPPITYSITTSISNLSGHDNLSDKLVAVAVQEYKAPYCQGISQVPVGSNGLPCAAEVGSTYHTFNSTSGAFDCAGFIQYVYSQIGIRLPRTAQAQFGNFYPADAKVVAVPGGQNKTVPGDLVYFSIPGDRDPEPAHVAMCFVAGCNTIIQDGGPPPGSPGTIAPLNELLCTDPNASQKRCVMGFMEVQGVNLTRYS